VADLVHVRQNPVILLKKPTMNEVVAESIKKTKKDFSLNLIGVWILDIGVSTYKVAC